MEPTRLNKYLVDAGVCSRREADRLMEEGRITVDGRRAVLGQKVTGNEKIFVDRKPVKKPESIERVYIAYHKPVGIICTSDPKAKDNIIEAVNYPDGRIFHIGRLDVASSGLILLTNDGDIVKVDKDITDEMVTSLRNGVHIGDDRPTLPAKIMKMGARMFSITIVEGRNRQIRRMCEAVGLNVESLKRIRVMGIKLDDIPPGKWRFLTEQETSALKAALV